jgi:hypothetical protein
LEIIVLQKYENYPAFDSGQVPGERRNAGLFQYWEETVGNGKESGAGSC